MIKSFVILPFLLFVCPTQSQEIDIAAPILNEKPKKGIFKTYQHFLHNQPSNTDSFYIELQPRKEEVWEGSATLIPRFAKNDRKIKDVWGFSDGHHVYIYHQIDYFPIEIIDSQINFFGYGDIDQARLNNVGVFMGPLHAGIAREKAVTAAKNQKIKYTIDLETSEINGSSVNYDRDGKVYVPTTTLIFYRDGKKELDQTFQFTFEEDIIYSLQPNSVLELTVDVSSDPLFVYFGEGFKEYKTLIIDEEKIYYIESSIPTKSKTPSLTEMDEVKGEYYYAVAKNAQKKREKKKD